jgi:hypothetical protein
MPRHDLVAPVHIRSTRHHHAGCEVAKRVANQRALVIEPDGRQSAASKHNRAPYLTQIVGGQKARSMLHEICWKVARRKPVAELPQLQPLHRVHDYLGNENVGELNQ